MGTCGELELESYWIKNRINNRVFVLGNSKLQKFFIGKTSRESVDSAKKYLIDAEAKILNSKKGICYLDQIVEFGLLKGRKTIVLEKVEGVISSSIRFDLNFFCQAVKKLSVAINSLHDMGITHNDITPSNILVNRDNLDPHLIDFELALKVNSYMCYPFAGTPCYMSPERINGGIITHYSDQYSFALVCFEWIVGRACWGSPELSMLTQPLRKVFAKALSLLTQDRYKSVLHFGKALFQILSKKY